MAATFRYVACVLTYVNIYRLQVFHMQASNEATTGAATNEGLQGFRLP